MTTIEENVVPGKRLGRHVNHDPRSRSYAFAPRKITLTSAKHQSSIGILDQGDLGSCTGNATVAALGCSPFYSSLSPDQRRSLNQNTAVAIYSLATRLDPFDGTWEPDDTGSDGLSVAKAAKQFGYISGYVHAFTAEDALAALVTGPVIIGIDWYEGFDRPDSNYTVRISGDTRGGHEVCLDEIDVERQLVWFRNSWGTYWGDEGRANMSFDTLRDLLYASGDATIFVPIDQPAPTPTPVEDTVNRFFLWIRKFLEWFRKVT